jgi:hypothetical protein
MPRKPLQFRISTLIWLIFASALFFGTVRHVRSASGSLFGQILAAMCFLLPLLWLVCRPNPFRGRTRTATVRAKPAGPIEYRLRQFMLNVSPIDVPTVSDSKMVIMPADVAGKAPRSPEEIAMTLRRIEQDHGQEQVVTNKDTTRRTHSSETMENRPGAGQKQTS